MSMENKQFYALLQVVQLIAADYEVQKQSLSSFVHVPDEIALLLADNIDILYNMTHDDSKSQIIYILIKELDAYFANMDKEKFTIEALRSDDGWEKARRIARAILEGLGQEQQKPDLSWVKFIDSSRE